MQTVKAGKQRAIPSLLAFLLLAGSLLTFTVPAVNQNMVASAQSTNEQLMAGSKLFNPTCSNSYCHGKEGVGGTAPTLRGKTYTADYLTKVISDGVPGTPMPAFKNSHAKKEIEQLVTYTLWLSKQASGKPLPPLPAEKTKSGGEPPPGLAKEEGKPVANSRTSDASGLHGDVAAGRFLFFDSATTLSCRACHTFQGRGGKLGPDLSAAGSKSARELYQSITSPNLAITPNYEQVAVTTRDGERIIGIKREEDNEVLKLFDTKTIPPVTRSILKSAIVSREPIGGSPMPGDYATRFTQKQLLDLLAFLRSTSSSSPVTLEDIK